MRRSDDGDRAGEREVDAEIEFHLSMREEQNLARGMDRDGAREEALTRFGDVRRIRAAVLAEDGRGRRQGGRWSSGLGSDLRDGLRVLWRAPAYAVVAVLTLAFGIAATALVHGIASPYFLRALPFADPDRLVHLYHSDLRSGSDRDRLSLEQFRDLRERARSFDAISVYNYRTTNLTGDEGPERLLLGQLGEQAFAVLGVPALLGRTLGPDDAGRADVVVLGWGLWQRRYSGDPGVLGRTVTVDGRARTVIGVMPREFNFPFGGVKLWIPFPESMSEPRADRFHLAFGKLAPGRTIEAAAAELRGIHASLAATYPDVDGRLDGMVVVPLREALNFAWEILRIATVALAGAVLFVLLIACTNVAGLSIARIEAKRREIAVRGALGASRWRLTRQVLVETLVLATVGGALGILMAFVGLDAFGSAIPEDLFRVGDFGIDRQAILFVLGSIVVVAVAAGVAPALLAASASPSSVLREGSRSEAGGRRAGRLRRTLIIAEVALGLVLVVGAGLMARSLERVRDLPLGFNPERVLTVEVTLPATSYPDADAVRTFYARLTTALAADPGFSAVATQSSLPLNHETFTAAIEVDGVPVAEAERPRAQYFRVSPGYFDVMEITRLDGRGVLDSDVATGEPIAVVSRSFARDILGGDAIGRRIRLRNDEPLHRVVGIVDDVRHDEITSAFSPQVYTPAASSPLRRQFVVARTRLDPAAAIPAARQALNSIDADLPAMFRPMRDVVDESLLQWSILATLLGTFSLFALGLGAIGLYGIIAFSVARRRKEIGVRIAIGASRRDVSRLVVGEGLRLAGIGVAIGVAGALAAGRGIAAALYGVSPFDPIALGSAVALFTLIAAAASFVPVWRALRADPLDALRAE